METKRILSLLLCLAMLLCLVAGCGSQEPTGTEAQTPAEGNTPLEEATVHTVSFPDALMPALELGIADEMLLQRFQETATREDVIHLISMVHKLQFNQDSKYLDELVAMETNEGSSMEHATRYYFAQAMYFSAMETVYSEPYTVLSSWQHYCLENDPGYSWPDSQVITMRLDGKAGEGGVWDICPDLQEIDNPGNASQLRWALDFGASPAVNYAMIAYDRTDGRKVLELDSDQNFRPHEAMTVEAAVQAALRYYNYFEDSPEYISYAETKGFDTAIITPELLDRETTLPDADCTNLPEEWRGVLMFDMGRVPHQALGGMSDKHVYEYEIQAVKEAGFNFIGLAFDFSILQGSDLEEGTLNETRLKKLDQVIAWCMERDIHIDLRCSGVGGLSAETDFGVWEQWNYDAVQSADYAPEFAALWSALAQRYADIPNCYLSFNLMIEPGEGSDEQYVNFFGPAVNAIKEVSPDRCIILDIHNSGLQGKQIAQLGAALSYHCYAPRDFCAITQEREDDPDYLQTVVWPYTDANGKTYSAADCLDDRIPGSMSANELAEIAAENNVGFMIGEFGIFGVLPSGYRYSMDTIAAFYTDMAEAMAEKGYGWAGGVWDGVHGAAAGWPMAFDGTYTQVEDYPYYTDNDMMALFRKITSIR